MTDFIMQHEAQLRLGCFLGIFAAVALAEIAAPRRALTTSKAGRWCANIGVVVLNTMAVRLVFPVAAMGMATVAEQRGWGLLNQIQVPYGFALVTGALALDFVIYLQHVMFHAVPTLWRLHMMHHADLDIDVTTGTRFHPIEILLSMVIKMAAVVVLGPPVAAVFVFEVFLNGTAMFNHGNVKLPVALDRVLRLFVVTPDMHRVHHSVFPFETNSNFGFNMPWWDRVMGTYRPQPRLGHEGMTIGLNQFRDPARLTLPRMLMLPFGGPLGNYAINRRGQAAGAPDKDTDG
jgi:sterol desaturase/sphingolipid hydroxylase (fatty acid hydroxylase superfamily)